MAVPGPLGTGVLPLPDGVDLSPLLAVLADRDVPGPAATLAVAALLTAAHPCPDARSYDVGPGAMLDVLPARPDVAAMARRRVRSFAAGGTPSPDRQDEVAVAVSEAVSNAVQHAHGGADGCALVLLVGTVDGALRVVVGDDGRWDDTPPAAHRGRGTTLMAALSDVSARYSDAQGTVVVLGFDGVQAPGGL